MLNEIRSMLWMSLSPFEIPFCRSQSIAFDVSPSQAFNASLQSSMGAPVRSRNTFTSAADTAAKQRLKTDRSAKREMIIFHLQKRGKALLFQPDAGTFAGSPSHQRTITPTTCADDAHIRISGYCLLLHQKQ
jgi:hypothetical protein